ncbi:MAG TPA: hypothetical protein VMV93_06310, partial [Chloroflexota bacterium]|nr:hypothetical protein [Chloroflexota bacterium]
MLLRAPAIHRLAVGPGSAPVAVPISKRLASPAWRFWLFLFLAAVYCLTSGGHTSSNDDEEMYYVTQGLVEHGSLALPQADGKALFAPRGADGHYYSASSHGILTSLAAVPLYAGGLWVADLFDPRYNDFITHAAVTGVPALATAATAVLLAMLAEELGAMAAGAAGLGLLYGLATIAWPYTKYFWSEPLGTCLLVLAVLFAIRAQRHGGLAGWAWAGAAMLLAVAARPAVVVCFPVLGLYALLSDRPWRRAGWLRVGWFCAPAAAGALALLAALATEHLVTRRGGLVLDPSLVLGAVKALQPTNTVVLRAALEGLLLSPGKSVFLYSPPALAGLLAISAFARKWPRQALLTGGLVLAILALPAMLPTWSGEAAWGPRYLVPATPFLVLPLAAWLRAEVSVR